MTLQQLKAKCEGATPGPWAAYDWSSFPQQVSGERCVRIEGRQGIAAFCFDGKPNHDALFIASANPQVVLALIACAETLKGMPQFLEELAKTLRHAKGNVPENIRIAEHDACLIASGFIGAKLKGPLAQLTAALEKGSL